MNLKNMFDAAKSKTKDNLPVILTSVVAIGSAAVAVYYGRRITYQMEAVFQDVFLGPKKGADFSLHLSGREWDKIQSGIPRKTGLMDGDLYVATKNMIKDEFLQQEPKLLATS